VEASFVCSARLQKKKKFESALFFFSLFSLPLFFVRGTPRHSPKHKHQITHNKNQHKTEQKMEESDQIILVSLKQIGCDLGTLSSLKDITADQLVDAVARLLRVIAPNSVWPLSLPKAMAAR
jgi:hypothetical protein